MAYPIEAHPGCNALVAFSKEENGKLIALGILNCPVIDKSDPANPVPLCVMSVLRNEGATKIEVINGVCPNGIKGLKKTRASKN